MTGYSFVLLKSSSSLAKTPQTLVTDQNSFISPFIQHLFVTYLLHSTRHRPAYTPDQLCTPEHLCSPIQGTIAHCSSSSAVTSLMVLVSVIPGGQVMSSHTQHGVCKHHNLQVLKCNTRKNCSQKMCVITRKPSASIHVSTTTKACNTQSKLTTKNICQHQKQEWPPQVHVQSTTTKLQSSLSTTTTYANTTAAMSVDLGQKRRVEEWKKKENLIQINKSNEHLKQHYENLEGN